MTREEIVVESPVGAVKDRPRAAQHRLGHREGRLLAAAAFVVYGMACVYLVFDLHYFAGDAQSRVANAYYVLFSQNPHLGAIGFVWNPLPSLLELPIVALHAWIPQVVTRGLAGDAVSAILGAWSVYHVHHILSQWSLDRFWRVLITVCFAVNPLVILYSSNGMSDIMWVACILGTYSGVLDYLATGSLRRLIIGSLWLVAGFGMRYEAVPFGVMLLLALLWAQHKHSRAKQIGSAILLGSPIVFGAGAWVYFNWLIEKDPLYFLNSSYGNLAQTGTGAYMTHAMARADHHLFGTLLYVARFGELYWPIYVGILLAVWWSVGRHRDARAVVILLGTIGAELVEVVLVYQGHLGEWDRYFLEFIPNGILLFGLVIVRARDAVARWPWTGKIALTTLLSLTAVSGTVGSVYALRNPTLGQPDGSVIRDALQRRSMLETSNNPYYGSRPLVAYINHHPKLTILADTFIDWPVVVRAHHLNQFVITSDYDFESILHNPRGRVSAILVPMPSEVAKLDAINRAWPGLWAGRVAWTRLIRAFPDGANSVNYRLYAVLPTAP